MRGKVVLNVAARFQLVWGEEHGGGIVGGMLPLKPTEEHHGTVILELG